MPSPSHLTRLPTCRHCGKPIPQTGKLRRYCSSACFHAFRAARESLRRGPRDPLPPARLRPILLNLAASDLITLGYTVYLPTPLSAHLIISRSFSSPLHRVGVRRYSHNHPGEKAEKRTGAGERGADAGIWAEVDREVGRVGYVCGRCGREIERELLERGEWCHG